MYVQEVKNALEKYTGLLSLWLFAMAFVLAARLVPTTILITALVLFFIAAALITTAGIFSAYVLARDNF
ncbi:MAG: hypothetical protein ACMXYD_04270 [Candidatus Woesearchaeota archaeon]